MEPRLSRLWPVGCGARAAFLAAWVGAAVLWAVWATRPRGPVELVDGFRSYESTAAVRALLQSRGYTWRVTYDHRKPPTPTVGRLDELHTAADTYHLFACTGMLDFEFFNDRLLAVGFDPADPAAFLGNLAALGGVDLRAARQVELPGVRVVTPRDAPGTRVRWTDTQLAEELMWATYDD